MQIKQTGAPKLVSKVDSDKREEVSKIKLLGTNGIPDSFETGKSRPAENQKELNKTQRDQANSFSPKVDPNRQGFSSLDNTTPQGAKIPDGAFYGNAKSNLDKNSEALRNFLAAHNIDVGGSDSSPIDKATRGGSFGISQTGKKGGGVTANDLTGTGTGPGNPMDALNKKFATVDYLKNLGGIGSIVSEMESGADAADGATHYFGKGMIAANGDINNSYTRTNPDGSKTTVKDTGHVNPKNPKEFKTRHTETTDFGFGVTYNVRETRDSKNSKVGHTEFLKAGDVISYEHSATWVDEDGDTHTVTEEGIAEKKGDEVTIIKSKSTEVVTDANGNVLSTTTTTTETKNGQKTTTTTTTESSEDSVDQDNYRDPQIEKLKQQMDEMSKNLGLDGLWNLHRAPKNQGKGPDANPEGDGISKDGTPSLIWQFGEYGLVGQPNQGSEATGSGVNSNFKGLPGDMVTDPLEGNPYNGTTRNEEVNTSLDTGMKEHVDNDDEEEEEKKPTIVPNFNPALKLQHFRF